MTEASLHNPEPQPSQPIPGRFAASGVNPAMDVIRITARKNRDTGKTSKKTLVRHAYEFELAAHEMLEEWRKARKHEEDVCAPDSIREEAANARKADASCLFALTKAWDASLERLRLLKDKPLPGSKRPTDPPPKVAKPKNKPPT